jgi:hypothetical protein
MRSPLEKPHRKAMKVPKAIKTLLPKPFSGKESKFKRMKEWFPLLEVYFEAQVIALDSEKI